MQVVPSPLSLIVIDGENRADLMGCLEFDLPPRFPFFDTVATKPPRRELNQGFENILKTFVFDANLIDIFHDLQYLTDLFIELSTNRTFTDRRELNQLAQSLRHRLLSCPSARNTTTPEDIIRESLRLSTLIYIKTVIPGYPSRDRVYRTLIGKLKSCIDDINLDGFASNGVMGELVLWLLFVAGIVDLGDARKAWFVLRISKVAEALQLREWGKVRGVLRKFSFIDELHDLPFSTLWNEIVIDEARIA